MSGHSKWHNIRVKKGAADAKRGKVFTRHAKLIEIAAQRGGDASMNPSLRTAIDNAKADSVPNANIERAVKKGGGELKGEKMEEMVYAAMGPGGTAYLIECLTDNKNRTLSNLKTAVNKNGGNFAESSSVLWMFGHKGVVVAKGPTASLEEIELELIDFGAEDIDADEDLLTVTTDMANWSQVRDFLKNNHYTIESAGLQYVASQKVVVKDEETAEKVMHFIDVIEEDDDVSQVFTNAELAD